MTRQNFYERCWAILVEHAGVRDDSLMRSVFVRLFTEGNQFNATEYRFQGNLGFGGKFWRNMDRVYVTCYPEDLTPKKDKTIRQVNQLLSEIEPRNL